METLVADICHAFYEAPNHALTMIYLFIMQSSQQPYEIGVINIFTMSVLYTRKIRNRKFN